MKKIAILLCLMLMLWCFCPFENICFADSGKTFIVTNNACIYVSPSLSAKKIEYFKNKSSVNLTEKIENADEFNFYKLETPIVVDEVEYSYILADLVVEQTQEITSIPNFNAKTNSACDVYFAQELADGLVYNKSDITLNKGEQIFLYKGFKRKTPYTAVTFLKDNQIFYGYLQTKNVSPNGVNPLILTCVFLILAVLGIVFAWVFIGRKKTKIKGKKIKSQYNLKN